MTETAVSGRNSIAVYGYCNLVNEAYKKFIFSLTNPCCSGQSAREMETVPVQVLRKN